jgi:tetratricopeptide (TPR) repeat protein
MNAQLLGLIRDDPDVGDSRMLRHAKAAGDEEAQSWLAPLAGHEASAAGAFVQAAEYFERAIALADPKDGRTLLDMSLRAAHSRSDAGHLTEALRHAQRAQAQQTVDDGPVLRGAILTLLAGINWELGHKARAANMGDAAIEMLQGTASVELAAALAYRARHAMADFDEALAIDLAREADVLPARFGRKDNQAFALATRCVY